MLAVVLVAGVGKVYVVQVQVVVELHVLLEFLV